MISVIAMTAKKIGMKLLMSMLSEKMLEWTFFAVAEKIVKSTKSPHDDEWLANVKESYYGSKEK